MKTLGGIIYQKALSGDENFLSLVSLTGYIKLAGGLFLLLLLRDWPGRTGRTLTFLALICGGFLFLYGFANFTTLVLDSAGLLNLHLDGYSHKWRLFFWEPFWMLGGILFIISGVNLRRNV